MSDPYYVLATPPGEQFSIFLKVDDDADDVVTTARFNEATGFVLGGRRFHPGADHPFGGAVCAPGVAVLRGHPGAAVVKAIIREAQSGRMPQFLGRLSSSATRTIASARYGGTVRGFVALGANMGRRLTGDGHAVSASVVAQPLALR